MIFDKILAAIGANKIKDGVVVGKKDYAPTSIIVPTGELVASKYVIKNNNEQIPERYSLIIRGTGVFGSVVTQEEYVYYPTWDSYKVGDKYEQQKQQASHESD